jgi:hypothetical protein
VLKVWLKTERSCSRGCPVNNIALIQILIAMLAAATGFGVLLAMIMVRGQVQKIANGGVEADLAFTNKAYLLASIIASIGAVAAFPHSQGAFAMFLAIALTFQFADHWLIPRMRAAAQAGEDVPLRGTRARFEILQAVALLAIFGVITMPRLATLARLYGL